MAEPTIDNDSRTVVSARQATDERSHIPATDIAATDVFSLHQNRTLQLADIDHQKLANYKRTFEKFDTDGSGSISLQELAEGMNTFGIRAPNATVLGKMIDRMRTIRTGHSSHASDAVSYEDFVLFLESQTADETIEDVIHSFFAASDGDGSGTLSVPELVSAVQRLGLNFSNPDAEALLGGPAAEINYEAFCANLIESRMDEMRDTEHSFAAKPLEASQWSVTAPTSGQQGQSMNWGFLRDHIDAMAKVRHVGRLARQSTLTEPEDNPVPFDPDVHLDYQAPARTYTLSELELPKDEFTVTDFAATEPFQLLSAEGVRQMLAEIYKEQVQRNCKFSSFKRAPNVIRGIAFYSTFIREFWRSPAVHEALQDATGLRLQTHPLDYEIGHVNIQESGSQKAAEQWHTDTMPFVVVLMLSDPRGMEGGETAIRRGDGREIDIKYSKVGQVAVLHGQSVPHSVRLATNMGRITMVTSAILDEAMVPDLSNLYVSSQYTDTDELYRQWAIYRFQMLNRWVGSYTDKLIELRRGESLNGPELIKQIDFLVDHLERTKQSLYVNDEAADRWLREGSMRDRSM
ncbi:MAG: hypothetical protein ETSY2_30495 [Candidatus Entotheonella gemina]|uniref:EF-hand domain-containing protein n=1 Tax=Candidatus Entotheonella gemina TaxID=1429439 RepID=W4M3C4_9BACT|nr:MAG: hypothetical protein ETSY2_30495 [Candidatus Entotheonella gemina]